MAGKSKCCVILLILLYHRLMFAKNDGLFESAKLYLQDGITYHISADYCNFMVLDDESLVIINMTTRCYCYDNLCSVPGITLIFTAGTSANILLENHLKGAAINMSLMNTYKDMDVLNIHTHGLHVDPAVDDISVYLNPIQRNSGSMSSHLYKYKILDDHQSGLHWYHSHWHGSVALSISGGLFGALIVENNTTDISFNIKENILILHSIWILNETQCNCAEMSLQYQYIIKAGFPIFSHCYLHCLQPKYQRNLSGIKYDIKSHSKYNNKFIYFVNGQYMPTINDIHLNEWRRLRFVNSDIQLYYQLNFDHNNSICNKTCNINIMALDGIYLSDMNRSLCNYPYYGHILIPPGGRADIAIQCNVEQIIHIKTSEKNIYNYLANYARAGHGIVILKLHIIDNVLNEDQLQIKTHPESVQSIPIYLNSLLDENSEQMKRYKLHKSCNHHRTYSNSIQIANGSVAKLPFCNNIYDCTKCGFYFYWTTINFKSFSMNVPLMHIHSNSIYEFQISADATHPYHNHVNPFQLVNNVDIHGFIGKRADWRDTLGFHGSYTVRIITLDYIGSNIIHCHILTHEDVGMMGFYQIVHPSQVYDKNYDNSVLFAEIVVSLVMIVYLITATNKREYRPKIVVGIGIKCIVINVIYQLITDVLNYIPIYIGLVSIIIGITLTEGLHHRLVNWIKYFSWPYQQIVDKNDNQNSIRIES